MVHKAYPKFHSVHRLTLLFNKGCLGHNISGDQG